MGEFRVVPWRFTLLRRCCCWRVAAAGAEISTGETISQQFADSPFGVLLTFSLIIAGSLFSYTANVEAPAAGPFTKEKELLNGRAAMVGMGIMLAYETVKGSALL